MSTGSPPLRLVVFSCSGAPLAGEMLEYIRRLSPEVLREISAVVVSQPKSQQRRSVNTQMPDDDLALAASRNIFAKLSASRAAIIWRFNKMYERTLAAFRYFLSMLMPVPYRCIEDFCVQNQVPVYRTRDVNSPAAISHLQSLKPDLIIIITFHHLLKEAVIEIPLLATLNVHSSLLPQYRGADPINEALADGVSTTGITIHWVDKGMDTGDIVCQKEVAIGDARTHDALRRKLAVAGGELLLGCLEQARSGKIARHPQPPT